MDVRTEEVVTVALDLSGSIVELVQVLTELLQQVPQTKADALALYHKLSVKLIEHLVSGLPEVEQKNVKMAMWALQEVEAVACSSWSCVPKNTK